MLFAFDGQFRWPNQSYDGLGEAVLEVKSVEICGSMGFGPTLLSRLTAGTADRVGFFGVGVCEVFRRAQQKFGEAQ